METFYFLKWHRPHIFNLYKGPSSYFTRIYDTQNIAQKIGPLSPAKKNILN